MKILHFILCVLLLASYDVSGDEESFAGGSGTANDPYQVSTAEHLNNVREYHNSHFQQIADIDLSEYSDDDGWEPIGRATSAFSGTYDGQGYSIKNLFVSRLQNNIGLFGRTNNAVLKNITITNGSVRGLTRTGGLVGQNTSTEIINCHFEGVVLGGEHTGGLAGTVVFGSISASSGYGTVSGGSFRTGGLVGNAENATIEDSHFSGSVSSSSLQVGGLLGYGTSGTVITRCYAENVDVEGTGNAGGIAGFLSGTLSYSYASGKVTSGNIGGGLVGLTHFQTEITNCYANVDVSATNNAGGGVGRNNQGTIRYIYSTGEISSPGDNVGGLVGNNAEGVTIGIIEYSYYNSETSGQEDEGKGIPKSTEQMQKLATYTGDDEEDPEWDFDDVWFMIEDLTYPVFRWMLSGEDYYADVVLDGFPDFMWTRHNYKVSLTLRNTGFEPWYEDEEVYLGAVDNHDDLVPSHFFRVALDHDVMPSQLHTFHYSAQSMVPGIFTTEWQMIKEGQFWFGEILSREMEVLRRTNVESVIWQLFE